MEQFTMHLISGTHWDREWRHTAEQSKPRLVDLVESILNVLEKNDSYKSFCLDGGSVVIEDYLSVKPENKERLTKLIKAGRIQLVNWYTLPDMFTVAAESIIRNIKLGQSMAAEFGGTIKSGYTATSYGQTSQLPQIYSGFGITNAIFYRGTNKYFLKPLFLWQSPDGSTIYTLRTFDEVTRTNWFFYVHQLLVLGKTARSLSNTFKTEELPVHFCDDRNYERALTLLDEKADFDRNPQALKTALETLLNQAMPYQVGKHLLAMNMEDNDTPFEKLPEMVSALNAVADNVVIKQSTLDEYMASIIADTDSKLVPLHKGELRLTAVEPGFNGLLGATHSSRIKLKLLNDECENILLNHAEPLASFAFLLGIEYPKNFLDRAWRFLLQNQAHDSICGAAVDEAHENNLYNYSAARTIGTEIAARSAISLFKNINTAQNFKEGDFPFAVFNTLSFSRKRVAQFVLDLPQMGGSEGVADICSGAGAASKEVEYYDIVDDRGAIVDHVELSKEKIQIGVERELDCKGIKQQMIRRRVLIPVELPGLGYRTYALRPRGPQYKKELAPGPDRLLLARENAVLENEHLKVTINPNGTFSLLHKKTGHLMENQHYFTDNGETGPAHMSIPPQRDNIVTSFCSCAAITMLESNPLRGCYRIDIELTVPAAATLDRRDRLTETRKIGISTWLTLEKDSRYLKLKTCLTNTARDHRLRVNFPTGIKTDHIDVESAFAIEKRCVRWIPTGDNSEKCYPFQPMQNFVDISDGHCGLAFLSRGLREYEVKDDAERTLAITLIRTQRAYMTANMDMTPDEFDKYTGCHSFGRHEYHYALYPHVGNWQQAQVLQAAYDHKGDIDALQGVPNSHGMLPSTGNFLTVTPSDKLAISAIKLADDGTGLIIRLWNPSDKQVETKIDCLVSVASAHRCTMNEAIVENLHLSNNLAAITVGPYAIETCLLKIK